jgi:hypothetical protein
VPICSSKPCLVRANGVAITPALLHRMSSRECCAVNAAAKARTESRSERSSAMDSACAPGTPARMRARASAVFPALRQASTTRAPWRASSSAVKNPRPQLAPVTTATLPPRSGICAAVHCGMGIPVAAVGRSYAPKLILASRLVRESALDSASSSSMMPAL